MPSATAPFWLRVAVLMLGVWAALATPTHADALPVTEVAPGIFVHSGRHEESDAANQGDIANCGFIVGADAVAVIDTGGGPAVGARLREAIRARTDLPIRYVIDTHMHPDHVLGNAAFVADKPDFVAHRNAPTALAMRSDHYRRGFALAFGPEAARELTFTMPSILVADRLEIDLGRRVLELVAHPPAHTDNDLTVFDRRTATLWTGDLVFMERVPVIDGSVLGWLGVMDALAAVPAARVVPGHGPASAGWPYAMADQRRYLDGLVAGIRVVQKAHGTIQQAITVPTDERSRWQLFDDYHPRNVTAAFAELEWE